MWPIKMYCDQTKTKEHLWGIKWLLGIIVKFKTIQLSVSDNNELTNDWQLQAQLELELELATLS